ncbi:hypothetical protein GCM10009104_33670 [Marinobacterium maritimum]|uniref:Methyltransferase domain-containing protein n=1 Tax=Marinobacterium maritimum TaxID=500162 RepID=A0ABP3TJC2_9GAMM
MPDALQELRDYLTRHHGGDGERAATRALEGHERNHDDVFRRFWSEHANAQLAPGSRVVDLGCGPGLFLRDLSLTSPELELIGVEAAPYMLERASREDYEFNIRVADLNDPPAELFDSNSIDVALANRLFHELHQPLVLLQKLHAWLKPGGVLILIDMVRQPLGSFLTHKFGQDRLDEALDAREMAALFEDYFEHNRYHDYDLLALLAMTGYEILADEPIRSGRAVQIAARKPVN